MAQLYLGKGLGEADRYPGSLGLPLSKPPSRWFAARSGAEGRDRTADPGFFSCTTGFPWSSVGLPIYLAKASGRPPVVCRRPSSSGWVGVSVGAPLGVRGTTVWGRSRGKWQSWLRLVGKWISSRSSERGGSGAGIAHLGKRGTTGWRHDQLVIEADPLGAQGDDASERVRLVGISHLGHRMALWACCREVCRPG